MLVLASKSTIMMLVTVIVIGLCIVVISAASIARTSNRGLYYYDRDYRPENNKEKGKHSEKP